MELRAECKNKKCEFFKFCMHTKIHKASNSCNIGIDLCKACKKYKFIEEEEMNVR